MQTAKQPKTMHEQLKSMQKNKDRLRQSPDQKVYVQGNSNIIAKANELLLEESKGTSGKSTGSKSPTK